MLLLAAFALPGETSANSASTASWSLWQTNSGDPVPRWPEAWPEFGGAPLIAPVVQRASDPVSATQTAPPAGAALRSVLDDAQVVSLYGVPGVPQMGALGAFSPRDATREAARVAAQYDELNGERGVIPALHLIVAVAQPWPMADGSYLARMARARIAEYVEVTREAGQLLFLDVQIGWSDPLAEVQRLRWALAEKHVHLALDPEFATRASGRVPGSVIGALDADEVNAVQHYLAAVVRIEGLPRKVLVLHQFLNSMLPGSDGYQPVDEVEVTVDMDGYGAAHVKLTKYDWYARGPYSERAAIKLFYDWDAPLLTPAQLQSLEHPPALIIYQ